MYHYEIDENNAIRLFLHDEAQPFLFQPTWPDNTPWANDIEATAWAEQYIASANDKTVGAPGDNPSQPVKPYVPEPEPVLEETPVLDEPVA